MKLQELKPNKGATRSTKRVGRGQASGQGCTSGKGNKGQKSRSGYSSRPWFEGGQMPLQRRIPKRGFRNVHAVDSEAVNVGRLDGLGVTEIDAVVLEKRGIIRSATSRLKVIGGGELATAISVRAHGFSKSAKQKIEAAGGKVDVIVIPRRPKRLKKKAERKS